MAEDLVRQKAEVLQVAPLTAWDLPEEWRAKIKGLPAPMLTQDSGPGYDDDSDSEFE